MASDEERFYQTYGIELGPYGNWNGYCRHPLEWLRIEDNLWERIELVHKGYTLSMMQELNDHGNHIWYEGVKCRSRDS